LENCHSNARAGEEPRAERAAALWSSALVVVASFLVTKLNGLLAEYLLLTLPWRKNSVRKAPT
jgi:hypothetical protein